MPDELIPGEKRAPVYKKSGFKMKGNPMQRNFGIGSPLHNETEKPIIKKNISLATKLLKKGVSKVKKHIKRKITDIPKIAKGLHEVGREISSVKTIYGNRQGYGTKQHARAFKAGYSGKTR